MNWLKLELTTEPTVEPVTLAEMRLWLKIDDGDDADDAIITSLIESARKRAEDYCNRAFIDQTWTVSYNYSPYSICLPKGFLDSVTSVNVIADDGTATLQSSDIYQVETGEGSLLFLESGQVWTTSTRPYGQLVIVFKSGYGAAATNVPEGIKTGIKELASYMYEERESTEIDDLMKSIFLPYKVYNI